MNPFHHILIPILMVICVALSVDVNYTGNWINGTSLLPRGNHAMAVGVYNGSIFMIGGRSTINKRAFVEYNTVSQQMIDHGTYIQQMTDTWGRGGQFYTQQMHIVYMIEFYGTMISTMDLSTNTFTSNWQTVSIMNPGVGTTGCLASTANHLYVVGGDNSNSDSGCLDTLQVFDMNAMQWISNTPSMTTIRYNVACIVHNGLLWAIGGHGGISCGQSALSSIERINVNNIQNKQWLTTNYSLLMPVVSARAIGFGNDILVIGGCFIKAMQIIDTMSDLVTMGVNMSYPLGNITIYRTQSLQLLHPVYHQHWNQILQLLHPVHHQHWHQILPQHHHYRHRHQHQ
eukprot:463665_1